MRVQKPLTLARRRQQLEAPRAALRPPGQAGLPRVADLYDLREERRAFAESAPRPRGQRSGH